MLADSLAGMRLVLKVTVTLSGLFLSVIIHLQPSHALRRSMSSSSCLTLRFPFEVAFSRLHLSRVFHRRLQKPRPRIAPIPSSRLKEPPRGSADDNHGRHRPI